MDDANWKEKEGHNLEDGRGNRSGLFLRIANPIWWLRMIVRTLRAALFALVPQFESPSHANVAGRRTSPTAFLDSLRGVAAFVVLIHHFSKDPFPWLPWGWGSKRNDVPQNHFLQLPIVRIIHSGPPMVAVFFVISGFALSYSPVTHIRRKDSGSLASALASSTFRRGLRLYLPCVATTLFMVFAMQFGFAPFPAHRKPEANIFAELCTWAMSMWTLLNPFDLSFSLPRYDDNLWTIPAEFRGSMALYITLLAVARLRYRVRLIVETVITCWLYSYGLWDVGLFITGLILAELHLEREERLTSPLPTPSATPKSTSRSRRRFLLPVLFLLSLHLTSAPLLGWTKSIAYTLPASFTPTSWSTRGVADRWIPTLGAPLLVYCADRSNTLRRVLTSSVGAYLGRISFGLYLVHGPIRYTAYHPLLEAVMRGWGLKVVPVDADAEQKGGWLKAITWIPSIAEKAKDKAEKAKIHQEEVDALDWRFLAAVALTWALLMPVILGVSDWFSRTVDRGSVRVAKRIEAKWTDEEFVNGVGVRSKLTPALLPRARSVGPQRAADETWNKTRRRAAS